MIMIPGGVSVNYSKRPSRYAKPRDFDASDLALL